MSAGSRRPWPRCRPRWRWDGTSRFWANWTRSPVRIPSMNRCRRSECWRSTDAGGSQRRWPSMTRSATHWRMSSALIRAPQCSNCIREFFARTRLSTGSCTTRAARPHRPTGDVSGWAIPAHPASAQAADSMADRWRGSAPRRGGRHRRCRNRHQSAGEQPGCASGQQRRRDRRRRQLARRCARR